MIKRAVFSKKLNRNHEKFRKKALSISIKEGSAAAVSTGISASYITPFILKLGGNSFHVGLLSSISSLISPLTQIIGSGAMKKYHRKSIVLTSVLFQAIMWLPLVIIAFLSWRGILTSGLAIYSTILFFILISALGGYYYPSWFSWMGDIVLPEEKGRYFAKRNAIIGIFELIAMLFAAVILQVFENHSLALLGFLFLFMFACCFKIISFGLFLHQPIFHLRPRKSYDIPIKNVIRENPNFGRFALYQAFFNFAIMIASPFFAVYMLKELGFNYIMYMAVTISSSIFYLLFTPIFGKFSDKFGNVKLLYISNTAFVLTPILWIFIQNPLVLIILPQLCSGIANASLIIAFNNFSYDYVKEEHRGAGIAYANVLVGLGAFVGSLIGGSILALFLCNPSSTNIFCHSSWLMYFVKILEDTFSSRFFFVFVLASILRLSVALIFLPKIKETKKVERIPPMHIHLAHPFKTLHAEIGWIKHVFK